MVGRFRRVAERQDALEAALQQITGESTSVVCAGRTDTGVHATGQVVATSIRRPRGRSRLGCAASTAFFRRVRGALRIRSVMSFTRVSSSARGRRYRYLLINRPQRPGVCDGRVGWAHQPLDVEVMQTAAQSLLGEHDFSAFRAADCQAKTPIKGCGVPMSGVSGRCFIFDFEAGAFLHHQVRNMVGSLVYIGQGKTRRSGLRNCWRPGIGALPRRSLSPDGLYLAGVDYEAHWGLPSSDGGGLFEWFGV